MNVARQELTGLVTDIVACSAVDGPGNRYVVFLQGCQFDCLACHNPCTIPEHPPWLAPTTVTDLVADIRGAAPFLSGVTVTGGEATGQADFVRALFDALAADPETQTLTRFVDSNGDADPGVWDLLAPVTDGVMVDLKALDPQMHLVLTGADNARVLAGCRKLAASGLLYEVRLLLIPGLNDADEVLAETARWLLELDPHLRVRVNAYRATGVRPCGRDLLEPGPDELARYRRILMDSGVTRLTLVG